MKLFQSLRGLAAVLATATLLFSDGPVAGAASRPNVILILADDLGHETLGAYGGSSYKTPVLDMRSSSRNDWVIKQ